MRALARVLLLAVLVPSHAAAELVRIDVQSRADLVGGRAFGEAGPYEKISGRLHFEVDPAAEPNRIITDIANAPRNARGRVEFSSDFYLIKPKQIERGNGTVLYEVSNRGGKGMLGFYNRATGSPDPSTDPHIGDGFLMTHGFTLLWVGWQFDVAQRPELMRVYVPSATAPADGKPITGLVRSEVIVARVTADASLADRDHQAYPVANPDDGANTLSVRDSVEGPRRFIPRSEWSFARDVDGKPVSDPTRVYLKGGFQPGKIYEVVYRAKDPAIAGLGPAAIRDTISRLKYGSAAELSVPAGAVRRAIGWGVSQSGRFLRTYLYYGFNEDEGRRKVFDGVMAHVAGAGRGSFNVRFAQPSRDGHPFLNKFYPSDIFPFTDLPQTDPQTGDKDGLLLRVKPEHTPRIFYTNSSYEYFGRAASLIHTTVDGRSDAPIHDSTRIYMFAGGQHGPGPFPPRRTIGQQLNNPNDYRWAMRALLVAMNRWITDGTAPPPSRYPRLADKSLVPLDALRFPAIAGIAKPAEAHKAYRVFYGIDFASKGIISIDPPEVNGSFPLLVPQVDADGNETGGIKMPEVAVPLATYTGWNHFNAEAGPPQLLSSMQGSYIPLAPTRADRERRKDPRRSVEERYADRDQYVGRVSAAADDLVKGGYLLGDDVPAILDRARLHWELAVPVAEPVSVR